MREVLALSSLASIGYGLWIIHPAAAMIGVGVVVFGLCVNAHVRDQ